MTLLILPHYTYIAMIIDMQIKMHKSGTNNKWSYTEEPYEGKLSRTVREWGLRK